MLRKFHIFVLLLSVVCLGGRTVGVCAADEELEYKVKAAFLLNFAKFTTWPEGFWPSDKSDFLLSVLGNDPFGQALSGLQEKRVRGKNIRLKYVSAVSSDLEQSQLLFVSKSERRELASIIEYTRNKPVVTVSDIEGFAAAGGIFEFTKKDGRLSFIINNSRAKNNGIHINSSLLKLAVKVL